MNRELLELEEKFWKGDAGFYERSLTTDALMVFPDPVGVLRRDAIVESIGASSRWRDVKMSDVQYLAVADDVGLLTYRASASRADAEPRYEARASSLYVKRDGAWQLAFHQQTPGG